MYSIHAQQKAKSPGGATPGDFFLDFTKKRRKAPAFRYGDIRRIQISE